ncbi:hypothetical protein K449DRAFT_450236 [Hypoxylon sp. EC38]|nr:hypothetical protein K449DRAFT_450236 [Hypoxylon sp. EC38]
MSLEAQKTLPTSPRGVDTGTTATVGSSTRNDCNNFQSTWCSYETVTLASTVRTGTVHNSIYDTIYTGCLPFIRTKNCGMTCSSDPYIMTCGPISLENTVECCTKVIDHSSLRLSSYECMHSRTTHTTLSDCDGSIRPARIVTPSSTITETTTYIPETAEIPPSIVFASIIGFLLLAAVIILAVWLLKRRKQQRHILWLSTGSQKSTTSHSPKPISHPSMAQRLGWMCIAALLAGMVFEIATLTFLSLFWGAEIREESNMIHTWIRQNDVARVVSVSSYILRTSISVHSNAAITMLAAIGLEKFTLRIGEVPELLINSTGHVSHYEVVLSFLPGLVRSSLSRRLLLLSTLSLAVLLSALQLSSTILLSDLDLRYTLNESAAMQVPVTYTEYRWLELRVATTDYYHEIPPKVFASFAEQGSYVDGPLQNSGFDFTGNLSRAFLPFSSNSDRQSLGAYSGYTAILDAGTLCVAPPLTSFEFSIFTSTQGAAAWIAGSIDWTHIDANITYSDLLQHYNITRGKAFNITSIMGDACRLIESEWFIYMFGLDSNVGRAGISERVFGFLNISSTDLFHVDSSLYAANRSLSDFMIGIDGPWTTLRPKDQNSSFDLALTICISGHDLEESTEQIGQIFFGQTKISSAAPRTEPTVTAGIVKDLDVSQLLLWLGITPQVQSLEERGILDLESVSPWEKIGGGGGMYDPITPTLFIWADEDDKYMQVCTRCKSMVPLHPVYVDVIQAALGNTGRPALAAQAFVTLIYQSLYYDQLLAFDIYVEANSTNWISVSMPAQWTGFIVVCALTAAHTLLVLGILIAFATSTKYIKLNDPWMAFAYASSGELAEVIEEAKRLKATDHVKMIEKQGLGIEMVGLGPDESDQNIGIRKRSQRVQSSDVENSADTTKQTAAEGVAEEHTAEASNTEASNTEASNTEASNTEASNTEASNTEEIVTEASEEFDEEHTTTGTDIQVARRD